MNEVELKRLAHRAVESVRREADRIADPESALARLLDEEPVGSTGARYPVTLDQRPSGRRRFWPVLASAAAIVALIAAVAVFARGPDDELSAPGRSPDTAPPTSLQSLPLVPPVTSAGPVRFEYVVSSYEGTDVITPVAINDTGVCFTVQFAEESASPCADAETISQGTMWGAFGHPDGGHVLHGVVPDAVDTVEIDGRPADFVGNVWSNRVPGDPVELRIGDSTTNRWVTITIELEQPVPPTTTMP